MYNPDYNPITAFNTVFRAQGTFVNNVAINGELHIILKLRNLKVGDPFTDKIVFFLIFYKS